MNTSDAFILIGIVLVFIVWALFAFAPKANDPEADEPEVDVDEAEFATIADKSFVDYQDFQIVSNALRQKFHNESKSNPYFERLDAYDDQIWVKFQVKTHYHALKKNTDRKIKKNDYGAITSDERGDEVIEFLTSLNYPQKVIPIRGAIEIVLDTLDDFTYQLQSFGFDPTSIPNEGFEFESWVANNLKKFGWNAEVTQGSGDQGLDVIAKKNDCRVGIQCKLYSSNVGNKAVQEINAAKAHFNLDKVAVLTSAGYTKSARELAQTCDVELLSHYDIPRFDQLFLQGNP